MFQHPSSSHQGSAHGHWCQLAARWSISQTVTAVSLQDRQHVTAPQRFARQGSEIAERGTASPVEQPGQ
ncbi:hypothetical protein AAFF_G00051920 [Aldrovandia affinis]|uniref:Uncharacterized protein n=1 Tax=Aldrovandia affinis TaxID=143900 RepID=A0AAD7T5S3_9TELE|nr:hypothetical protein AAFF_G00051920 [Aldrovandia affinis]